VSISVKKIDERNTMKDCNEYNPLDKEISAIQFYEMIFPNATAEATYGIGYWLKKYLRIPVFIPLHIFMDHHVPTTDEPYLAQLNSTVPVFVTREAQQSILKNKYLIKSYVMGAPFVYCRWLNQIEQAPNAQGTIAFPSHSTHLIDTVFDWESYADTLLTLPAEFQPITVCLYWKDLLLDRQKPFADRGMTVVTAGHMIDPSFTVKFYNLMKKAKYTTSNLVGSFAYYSIEMNIPFFLYGERPMKNNFGGDLHCPPGLYERTYEDETYFNYDFSKPITISPFLKQKCIERLGIDKPIDKKGLKRVIYLSVLKVIIIKPKELLARIVSKSLPQFIKKAIYHVISKDLREERHKNRMLQEIALMPRYSEGTIDVLGKQFKFVDSASFLSCYTSIFKNEMFKFRADNETPYIIDCGANIGLSVLYFKKLYPSAMITAFEPDKKIFNVLKENVEAFHLTNIELVNKGVWKEDSVQRFFADGSDAGRIAHAADQGNIVEVPMVSLRKYLDRPVDFLKVDIEGAETEALKDCEDLLKNVKRLYVEYHSFAGEEQMLDELLSILRRAGFRISIGSPMHSAESPFQNVNEYMGMDLQLDIFGYQK
jgi:FkbM family methyltransferase